MSQPHYEKRHYIEIAKLLKQKGSLDVNDFVELFSADNSRFDEGRFRYASEPEFPIYDEDEMKEVKQ